MGTADISLDKRPAAASVPVPQDPRLRRLADCISVLALDAVELEARPSRNADGYGRCRARALPRLKKFDAADPYWIDRDRFLSSNGHGSMLLYALSYLMGVEETAPVLAMAGPGDTLVTVEDSYIGGLGSELAKAATAQDGSSRARALAARAMLKSGRKPDDVLAYANLAISDIVASAVDRVRTH